MSLPVSPDRFAKIHELIKRGALRQAKSLERAIARIKNPSLPSLSEERDEEDLAEWQRRLAGKIEDPDEREQLTLLVNYLRPLVERNREWRYLRLCKRQQKLLRRYLQTKNLAVLQSLPEGFGPARTSHA